MLREIINKNEEHLLPSADPCGIPIWIVNGDDDAPFIRTDGRLFVW